LDSNVFISAKNAHYGMDFAPGFWDWLAAAHAAGVVYSVEAVRDELKVGADELATWVKKQPPSFFLAVDQTALDELRKLAAWVKGQSQYTGGAGATFLASADYFLVGQAKALGFTLVTHEMPAPDAKSRVRIPEACIGLGVSYSLPWRMLRNEGARFIQ
jgi:Domain of unknown function (DUF4411)